MNGVKTASEKRLAKLQHDQQVKLLVNLYEERLANSSLPKAESETIVVEIISDDGNKAIDVEEVTPQKHLGEESKPAPPKKVSGKRKEKKLQPIPKYVWWFSKEEYQTAMTMDSSKSLKMSLLRLKKVTEGGWLINGTMCTHHSGPKKCNGIVIDERIKALIETKGLPGKITLFQE